MLPTPSTFFDNGELLQWSKVHNADGYNIYLDGRYVGTVRDELEFNKQGLDGVWQITTFVDKQRFSVMSEPAETKLERNFDEAIFYDFFQDVDLGKWSCSMGESWSARYIWNPEIIINDEQQAYVDPETDTDISSPFLITDDGLTIEALRRPYKGQNWTSGVLAGFGKQDYLYGVFEAEMRCQNSAGLWPAFWLLNSKYNGPNPEIDIMEFIGKFPDRVFHNYHVFTASGLQSGPQGETFVDPSEWHRYAVRWEPNLLVYYVDGEPVHVIESELVSDEPMYPILNLAIGGNWSGLPDDELERATLDVRYFAAWAN